MWHNQDSREKLQIGYIIDEINGWLFETHENLDDAASAINNYR